MNSGQRAEIHINRWLIGARWFFYLLVFGAVLIQQLVSEEIIGQVTLLGILTSPLVQLIFGLLMANAIFLGFSQYLLNQVEQRDLGFSIEILGAIQVITDLVGITLLIILGQVPTSIYPVLFFLPIVESIVLFNLAGPVAVAVLSSLLVSILTILAKTSSENLTFQQFFQSNDSIFKLNSLITSSVMTSTVYLIIGFFAAYIVGLVRDRSNLLAREGTVLALSQLKSDQFAAGIKVHEREMSTKELELALAYNRLQKGDEARSKFVSVTTHQMRTPLAGIKWTLDMILSGQLGPVTDDQREFLKRGFDSTEKLVHIVNDLLSVDSIEEDKTDYRFTPVDLVGLISSVVSRFANQARSRKIKVEFVPPPSSKLMVTLDQDKVIMVLENLIDNAIKYTREGQVWVGINDAQANAVDPRIEVVVADQGMGISAEDHDKIFHKFFRAGNAVRTEPDGSGLGLFIAKDVIEKHGGSIWFTDRQGGGTEFHFTLPLHQKKV